MPEYTARLEEWRWDPNYSILWGFIYDDKPGRFVDRTWIHTSQIDKKKFSKCKEGDIVETLNSSYLLGKPLKPQRSPLNDM